MARRAVVGGEHRDACDTDRPVEQRRHSLGPRLGAAVVQQEQVLTPEVTTDDAVAGAEGLDDLIVVAGGHGAISLLDYR